MADRDLNAEMNAWQAERDLQAEMDAFKASQEKPTFLEKVKASGKQAVEDWRDLSEGIGASGIETYLGVKDLIPGMDVTDEDRAVLKKWKDASNSGWGTAGRMTGEVAQMALPASAGVKLATKIPKALKHAQGLRSATRLGGDVGGAALHGAVRLPGEGQTRLENAAESAKYGLGGAALGKALRVGGMGVKGTPEAQRLRAQGVELSPGRVNDALARAEGLLNLLPVGAKAVQKARGASNESFRQVAQKMADPKGRLFNSNKLLVPKNSREINAEIGKAFKEGYTDVWSDVKVSPSFMDDAETIVLNNMDNLGKKKMASVSKLLDEIKGKDAETIDDLIRQEIRTGKPDKIRAINGVLRDMRKRLRQEMPNEKRLALKALDEKYGKFSAIKNATTRSSAEKASGDFTMQDLLGGQAQASYKNLRATGGGPYTQYLDDAFKAIGDEHQPLLTSSRAWIQRFPGFGTGAVGRRLAGTGLGQRATREAVDNYYPELLRNYVSGAKIGAAYEE